MVKTVTTTRYITPLREGGSLPAVVDADDGNTYGMKFSGAGQGVKALIAELISGEIGRALGLPVPEIVFMELDAVLGRSEPDPEIADLLEASEGLNLGLRFLSGALNYEPMLNPPDAGLASAIVWFDAYITNVDRTARNVNMLMWQEELWLIDHGASLYFHHAWQGYQGRIPSPFAMIKDHVLLRFASAIPEADAVLRETLTPEKIDEITSWIPDEWLSHEPAFASEEEHRAAYREYLTGRLEASQVFTEEATSAHRSLRR